jgi:hypothetical protein
MRHVQNIVDGEPYGKSSPTEPKHRWEINIKIELNKNIVRVFFSVRCKWLKTGFIAGCCEPFNFLNGRKLLELLSFSEVLIRGVRRTNTKSIE